MKQPRIQGQGNLLRDVQATADVAIAAGEYMYA